jgi:integrase
MSARDERGSLQFDRDFTRIGVGRILNRSGVHTKLEFDRRNAILTQLAEGGQVDVLKAFKAGRIPMAYLLDAQRKGTLLSGGLLTDAALEEDLWAALDRTLPTMGRAGAAPQGRYWVSRLSLERKAVVVLPPGARVRDLAQVPWGELAAEWGASAADWNHVRRMLSAFLSTLLADKYGAFARQFRTLCPTQGEGKGRVPDISPEFFLEIVARTPEHVHVCYWTLVLIGMRCITEYLACTTANLLPETKGVRVPGTKTDGSADVVYVHPELWQWVESGIPSPVAYKWLREYFKRAVRALGQPGLRLHDLRHCYGQWAANGGAALPALQSAMRHADPKMTMRYIQQVEKGTVGMLTGEALIAASEAPKPRPKLRRVK